MLVKFTVICFVALLSGTTIVAQTIPTQTVEVSGETKSVISAWVRVPLSHTAFQDSLSSDAFKQDGFELRVAIGEEPIYMLREGWEDGWQFFVKHKNNWENLGHKEETYSKRFDFGDFNGDKRNDLLLFAVREDNLLGMQLPQLPRLLTSHKTGFLEVPLACSGTLHAFFLSRMTEYLNIEKNSNVSADAEKYRSGIVKKEQDYLMQICPK